MFKFINIKWKPKSEEPVIQKSEEPVIQKSEEPVIQKSEEPVIQKSEEPVIQKSEEPVKTGEKEIHTLYELKIHQKNSTITSKVKFNKKVQYSTIVIFKDFYLWYFIRTSRYYNLYDKETSYSILLDREKIDSVEMTRTYL